MQSSKSKKEIADIIIEKIELIDAYDKQIKILQDKYIEFTNEPSNNLSVKLIQTKSANSIQIIKNKIKKYCFIYPSIILNKYSTTNYSKLPKHWNLSKDHYGNIRKLIDDNYSWIEKYYEDNTLTDILPIFIKKYKEYENIILNIYTIPLDNNEYILDKDFVLKILLYIYLDILSNVFDATTNVTGKKIIRNIMINYKNDNNIFEKTFDLDMELIEKRVLKAKEREKDRITRKLKKMNDADREISKVLKENKLGEWNIGEQKGLRIYDKNFRDMNRPEGDEFYIQRDMENEFSYAIENEET